MAKQYLINLLLRGHSDAIEFEVRENDWLRAQSLFDQAGSFYRPARFLTFDAVEGLAVAISFSDVQLVRFLWNPVKYPSDQKHTDGDVQVSLRGREEAISISTGEEKDSLSAFFILLDTGAEHGQFPGFTDIDGELVVFNAEEIVLVTAPLHEVSQGHRILNSDQEADANGDTGDIPF